MDCRHRDAAEMTTMITTAAGANLAVDVPGEAAVVYVDDMWLNEDRSVRLAGAAFPAMESSTPPPPSEAPAGAPPADAARETAAGPDAAVSPLETQGLAGYLRWPATRAPEMFSRMVASTLPLW